MSHFRRFAIVFLAGTFFLSATSCTPKEASEPLGDILAPPAAATPVPAATSPVPADPQGATRTPVPFSEEFWEADMDLRSAYDVCLENLTTYGLVTDLVHVQAQDEYIATIMAVYEEYEPYEATDATGRTYTDYRLVAAEQPDDTFTIILPEDANYYFYDPYDSIYAGPQPVPRIQFVDVCQTLTAHSEPYYFEFKCLAGEVYSAKLWDMYYVARNSERKKEAAQAAAGTEQDPVYGTAIG